MKIAMAGIGRIPIDETADLGPEVAVWQLKINLEKLGAKVDIINTKDREKFLREVERIQPDILHTHHLDLIELLMESNVPIKVATTQNPYMDKVKNYLKEINEVQLDIPKSIHTQKIPFKKTKTFKLLKKIRRLIGMNKKPKYKNKHNNGRVKASFKKQIKASAQFKHYQKKLYIFCMSNRMMNLFSTIGIDENRMFVTPNGANSELFRYHHEVKNPDKSIYVANIADRKRQYLFQSIKSIDFVGGVWNNLDSKFDVSIENYLGKWSRDEIHDRLTDYANLVLLSNGEAHPLTVCEAMMCGLGVVVSEVASGNLDLSKEFIDVIPEEKILDTEYVENIILKNRTISINMRDEIRSYAMSEFSWANRAKNYFEIAQNLTNQNLK